MTLADKILELTLEGYEINFRQNPYFTIQIIKDGYQRTDTLNVEVIKKIMYSDLEEIILRTINSSIEEIEYKINPPKSITTTTNSNPTLEPWPLCVLGSLEDNDPFLKTNKELKTKPQKFNGFSGIDFIATTHSGNKICTFQSLWFEYNKFEDSYYGMAAIPLEEREQLPSFPAEGFNIICTSYDLKTGKTAELALLCCLITNIKNENIYFNTQIIKPWKIIDSSKVPAYGIAPDPTLIFYPDTDPAADNSIYGEPILSKVAEELKSIPEEEKPISSFTRSYNTFNEAKVEDLNLPIPKMKIEYKVTKSTDEFEDYTNNKGNSMLNKISYNSNDDVKIYATIKENDLIIGEIKTLSYSIYRQPAPIYTMGEPFERGKRKIAGSIIFSKVNRGVSDFSKLVLKVTNTFNNVDLFCMSDIKFYNKDGNEINTFAENESINFIAEKYNAWDSIPKEEDIHKGQIYNPYTNTWSWI